MSWLFKTRQWLNLTNSSALFALLWLVGTNWCTGFCPALYCVKIGSFGLASTSAIFAASRPCPLKAATQPRLPTI